jgi:cell shape-determining protein MreC
MTDEQTELLKQILAELQALRKELGSYENDLRNAILTIA